MDRAGSSILAKEPAPSFPAVESGDQPSTINYQTIYKDVTMSNMRDERGRLLPGHPGISPGRPPREKEEAILQTIREEATPERVRAVLAKLYESATVHGSVKAAQLWLGYAAGRPKELGTQPAGQANIDLMRQAMLQYNENQRLEQRVVELESAINAKVIEGVTQ